MKKPSQIIRLFLLLFLIVGVKVGAAQATKAQLAKAHHTPGKIKFQETPDPTWTKLFASLDADQNKALKPFKKGIAKISSIVIDVTSLTPPKGFRVEPFFIMENFLSTRNFTPVPPLEIVFANYEFLFDKKTHQVSKQHVDWSVSINVYLNYSNLLLISDEEVKENCEAIGIPMFYYKPETHIDPNGFLVLDSAIRVVKKKGIPLYSPVTQKEYLGYKKKLSEKKLHAREEWLKKDKKKLQHLKFESNRSHFESNIKYHKQFIAQYKREIGIYEKALNSRPKEKLKAPAYTSNYYYPGKGENPIDLVAPSVKGARELVRFNKNYFDKSIPEGIPQLISVEFNDGGRFGSAYMKKVVKAWFNQIDYGKLQAMVK